MSELNQTIAITQGQTKTKTSALKRVLHSPFVWLLFCLILAELFLFYTKPLRLVFIRGTMLKDNDVVGAKIEHFLNNPLNANTIIVGDSTADPLCSYADMVQYKLSLNSNNRYSYFDAKYADRLFNDKLDLKMKSKNLYFGGCLVSDQELLIGKLLQAGKKPSLAIVTVVPRPFLDSTVDTSVSPVNCYFSNRHRGLERVKNFPTLVDHYLHSASNIYRTRSDYATILSCLACTTFSRPLNSGDLASKGLNQNNTVTFLGEEDGVDPLISAKPEWIASEANHYKQSYALKNSIFNYQYKSFNHMLGELKRNNVMTLVVKLPLEKSNLDLLPPGFSTQWDKMLIESTRTNGAELIDLQRASQFSSKDFRDNVHLTGPGAIKVWALLSEHIKNDPTVKQKLKAALNK